MRYALISDIHGNLPALEAVIDDEKNKRIDKYVFLGDYCRDLHYPNEVVNTIKNIKNKNIIRGNSEDYFDIVAKQDQSTWEKGQFNSLRWCYNELTKENRAYLSALPQEEVIKEERIDIYAFHSYGKYFSTTLLNSVTSGNFAVATRDTPAPKYLEILKNQLIKDESMIKTLSELPDGIYAFGHNHIQMYLDFGNKLLINPGSCSMPLDFPGLAAYSILETSDKDCHVQECRVAYDLECTIEALKNSSQYSYAKVWSELIIKQLLKGREHIRFFLEFLSKHAEKPYSQKDWEEAYEIWSKQN
jgi:putative phosphoesterase